MANPTPSPLARGAMALLLLLMLAGAAIGVYMTQHHEVELYGGESAQFTLVGCAEAEGVSCDIVNTSPWSEVPNSEFLPQLADAGLGVPTFTWAIPTYLLLALLAGLALRGDTRSLRAILVLGVLTSAFSLFLWYVSKVQLHYVCLWCMRLYVINFATPILALVAGALKAPSPTGRDLGVGVAVFALLSTFAVGGQRAYRATLLGDSGSALVEAKKSGGGAKAMDHDPEGPAPVLTFQVKTEDGNDKTLRTRATDPWKGNPDAKVAIVEFADFECGYCKRASSQLRRLYEAYGDRIVFVYKHFPMDPACNPGVNNRRHGDACNAAAASVCAQDQGKFWQFHDIAFKNQHELDPDDLELYAKTVGLDLEKFRSCVRDEKTLARVKESAADGAEIESHGTPRIWINGRLYRAGASAEQMASEIARALNEAPQAFAEDDEAPFQPIPADVPTMRHVSAGGLDFWIDTFEASLVDGKAHVGKHEIPATRMSWFAARDACEAAGKHVCTEQEWTAACQGAAPVDDDADGQFADDMIEGTTYPYGDFNDPRRCWSDKGKEGFRPVYTGEMPGCISKDGVYDLAGNVEEWVGTTPENAVLLGGAYDTADDKARCFRRNDTFGAGYAHLRTGFRCCAPTNVP